LVLPVELAHRPAPTSLVLALADNPQTAVNEALLGRLTCPGDLAQAPQGRRLSTRMPNAPQCRDDELVVDMVDTRRQWGGIATSQIWPIEVYTNDLV
jgi:hypothetical protein